MALQEPCRLDTAFRSIPTRRIPLLIPIPPPPPPPISREDRQRRIECRRRFGHSTSSLVAPNLADATPLVPLGLSPAPKEKQLFQLERCGRFLLESLFALSPTPRDDKIVGGITPAAPTMRPPSSSGGPSPGAGATPSGPRASCPRLIVMAFATARSHNEEKAGRRYRRRSCLSSRTTVPMVTGSAMMNNHTIGAK